MIPAALVRSTTAAAVRFSASRTISSASVAALAQGVLNTMSTTRWMKVASVLLVAGATASGVGLISRRTASGVEPTVQKKAQPGAGSDMPVVEVKSGKFRFSVPAPGSIEATRRLPCFARSRAARPSFRSLPEGSKVKKGSVVCELDSASLRDQLTNQKIATQAAEAAYQNAKLARNRPDRSQGIPGRSLPAGQGHDPGRNQAGRIRGPESQC